MAVTDRKATGNGVAHRLHLSVPKPMTESPAARYIWALARLSLGWVFLWAFLDKWIGLGHETAGAKGWLDGGNPTQGFLSHAKGAFAGFYHNIAGDAWVNWLFMLALLGLGIALILGIGMRVAAVAGTILLVMMWSASLPPENNVFMDDHIIYALLLIGLVLVSAGETLGFGKVWANTSLVRRMPFLK